MAQFAARSILNKARLSAAQVFFQPEGSAKLFNLGNMQEMTYTPEIEEWEDWSRQHGSRVLAGTYPIQKSATVTISTTSWTEMIYQLMYVSGPGYLEQAEVTSQVFEFAAPAAGDIYRVPVRQGTVDNADDGEDIDPVVWTEGTHYTFHGPSGIIEILAVPEGANKLELTVSATAITADDKLLRLDLMETEGVTGRLIAVGTNQVGAKGELNVGRVKFLPSQGIASVGGDEGDAAGLTGRVYADSAGRFGTWTAYEKI